MTYQKSNSASNSALGTPSFHMSTRSSPLLPCSKFNGFCLSSVAAVASGGGSRGKRASSNFRRVRSSQR